MVFQFEQAPPGLLLLPDRKAPSVLAAMVAALIAGRPYAPISLAALEQGRLSPHLFSLPCVGLYLEDDSARFADALHQRGVHALGATPSARGFESLDGVAYLLHTSGSTGAAKGVLVRTESVSNLIDWAIDRLVRRHERVFGLAPLTFDLSILDLLAAICAGGSYTMVQSDVASEPAELFRVLHASAPTFFQTTPSIFGRLVNHVNSTGREAALPNRHELALAFAGEPLEYGLVRQSRKLGAGRIWNLYGPTETIHCTAWEVPGGAIPQSGPVPIGWPIPGVEIALSNEVEGEATISGICVANGYIGPSSENFFERGGERAYRTGDVLRRSGDAGYEFVTRSDAVRKVNGVRIDLCGLSDLVYGECGVAVSFSVAGNRQGDVLVAETSRPSFEVRRTIQEGVPIKVPIRFQEPTQAQHLPSGKTVRYRSGSRPPFRPARMHEKWALQQGAALGEIENPGLLLRIRGEIREDTLRSAVRRLSKEHPDLFGKLHVDLQRIWLPRNELEEAYCVQQCCRSIHSTLSDFLGIFRDSSSGIGAPALRCWALSDTKSATWLAFRFEHLFFDSWRALKLCSDVLGALDVPRGEPKVLTTFPAEFSAYLPTTRTVLAAALKRRAPFLSQTLYDLHKACAKAAGIGREIQVTKLVEGGPILHGPENSRGTYSRLNILPVSHLLGFRDVEVVPLDLVDRMPALPAGLKLSALFQVFGQRIIVSVRGVKSLLDAYCAELEDDSRPEVQSWERLL